MVMELVEPDARLPVRKPSDYLQRRGHSPDCRIRDNEGDEREADRQKGRPLFRLLGKTTTKRRLRHQRRSPYSLIATASAASSHRPNASEISAALVLYVNTKGSTEETKKSSDAYSLSSELTTLTAQMRWPPLFLTTPCRRDGKR